MLAEISDPHQMNYNLKQSQALVERLKEELSKSQFKIIEKEI